MYKPIFILERSPIKSLMINDRLSKIISASESMYFNTLEVNVPTIIIEEYQEEVLWIAIIVVIHYSL